MRTKIYDDQLIVVTGASGMIGSGVVRTLNDLGFTNLLLVDDFGEDERWKNCVKKKYVEFISKFELFEWLEGRESEIEAFIHLGAESSTVHPDHDYYYENNYRYSVDLAEYALTHNHRFVYASSAATFGNGARGFSDDHAVLPDLEPLNMYGYSKHMVDLWLQSQGALDDVIGLKYFNVYGPNEWHKGRMASMVLHMKNQIEKEGKVKLFASNNPDFSDGEQCRDFIYVKDAARMTCQLMQSDVGGIFNIGGGEAVTWNRLASSLFDALGVSENIEYIPMPEDLQKGYQNYTCAEMEKYHTTVSEKGIEPIEMHSIEAGVADYVQNHLTTETRW